MAKTDLTIPSLGNKFIDLRDSLPGDAYKWSWERSLSQVNFLAIHSTGGLDTQTPEDIALGHINRNGWGGIGYHFLISKTGEVFYVGDITTARANVANLNEQVLGIGIIGNFTNGLVPTTEQLDSAHKLCEFFISYSALTNITSWDKVRGHKELPNQSTNCPGETFQNWRIQIVEGVLESQDQIVRLQSQVDSLQASLASVNQQAISLQEVLQEREQQISELKKAVSDTPRPKDDQPLAGKVDSTLTIIQALVNLYKFALLPRKES